MSSKPEPLTIIVVDDSSEDASRLVQRLKTAGFAPIGQQVETEREYRVALTAKVDAVFADATASRLSARRALDILRDMNPDVPFIVLSRSSEEEVGLESLINEATDVVLKNRLDLAGSAVRRALREARSKIEQKNLEDRLRLSEKMDTLGRLASGVAHDFNNILMVIMADANLALLTPDLPPDASENLKNIQHSAGSAAALTRQLLKFGRPQPLRARPIDLNDVVSNLATMLCRLIGEAVPIQFNLAPEKVLTQADENMIEQVILNLVINARDSLSSHGQIAVETFQCTLSAQEASKILGGVEGDFVGLRVIDNGSGIAEKDLPRIFDPFFTTKDADAGSGLGLSTVLRIVQEHQGFIHVHSGVAAGTTIEVFLPPAPASSNPGPLPAPTQTKGGTETILLVEDDPTLRRLASLALVRHGYNVVQASDANAALHAWAEQARRVDLLITDVVLPAGISGVDLAAQLRDCQHSLKVIFMSGFQPPAIAPTEHMFIQKPCDVPRLVRTVRECLDKR
jgi:two-component system cell cycle sensor histidine kinase/response regulator CckA